MKASSLFTPEELERAETYTLLSSAVQLGISRQVETMADVDALKATGDPVAFVAMQRTLAPRSIADPTPPAWSQRRWGVTRPCRSMSISRN